MQIPLTETHPSVVRQSRRCFVCLGGCLWALPAWAWVCVCNDDPRPCGCTAVQRFEYVVPAHVCHQARIEALVCAFVSYVSARAPQFLLSTVWLTAAINRIKSKWARAPFRSLQSPPSRGSGGNIQTSYWGCICTVCVWCKSWCVCVRANAEERGKDINVLYNKTEDLCKWTRASASSVSLVLQLQCLGVWGWIRSQSYTVISSICSSRNTK